MPRFKLTIEYDGGPFVGWQRQTNGRSVQQAIEEALARLTAPPVDSRSAWWRAGVAEDLSEEEEPA